VQSHLFSCREECQNSADAWLTDAVRPRASPKRKGGFENGSWRHQQVMPSSGRLRRSIFRKGLASEFRALNEPAACRQHRHHRNEDNRRKNSRQAGPAYQADVFMVLRILHRDTGNPGRVLRMRMARRVDKINMRIANCTTERGCEERDHEHQRNESANAYLPQFHC